MAFFTERYPVAHIITPASFKRVYMVVLQVGFQFVMTEHALIPIALVYFRPRKSGLEPHRGFPCSVLAEI